MSKSGLFAHFGSKEELQLATVDHAASVFVEEVIAPAREAPKGIARVWALCDHMIGYSERQVFPGGCFFASAAFEFNHRPGPVRDHIRDNLGSWMSYLEHAVEQAQDLGELDGACRPASSRSSSTRSRRLPTASTSSSATTRSSTGHAARFAGASNRFVRSRPDPARAAPGSRAGRGLPRRAGPRPRSRARRADRRRRRLELQLPARARRRPLRPAPPAAAAAAALGARHGARGAAPARARQAGHPRAADRRRRRGRVRARRAVLRHGVRRGHRRPGRAAARPRRRRGAPRGDRSTSSTTWWTSTPSTSMRPTCSRSSGRAATSSARCAAGSSSGA